MNLGELWTGLLAIVAQIIIPVWNDLIQYLPLVIGLLVLSTHRSVWSGTGSATPHANRSRVPQPIPTGRKPEDMHLPGPSLWPFVAPIGLVLMLFAVVFGPLESLANDALLVLGLAVAVIGIVGWYLDANKEYAEVEAGGHGHAEATTAPPGWSLAPPRVCTCQGPRPGRCWHRSACSSWWLA